MVKRASKLKKRNARTSIPFEFDKNLLKLFKDVQKVDSDINSFAKKLIDMYNDFNEIHFWENVSKMLDCLLIEKDATDTCDRMIDFISRTAPCAISKNKQSTSCEIEDEDVPMLDYIKKLILFFITRSATISHFSRERSCMAISLILRQMGYDAVIDESVFKAIMSSMLERVLDVKPAVRINAILALSRLQQTNDPNCPINKAFLELLSKDENADVRKTTLTCINVSKYSIKYVVDRCKDVNASIRKAAFEIVADKVHIKALKIVERLKIIKSGIHDKSAEVKKVCETVLIPSWLHYCKDDVNLFVKALDVENNTEFVESIMTHVLKLISFETLVDKIDSFDKELKTIDYKKLDSRTVFVWLSIVKYVKEVYGLEKVELFLPCTKDYLEYLRVAIDYHVTVDKTCNLTIEERIEHDMPNIHFIIMCLIRNLFYLDSSDIYNRNALNLFLSDVLLHTPLDNTSVEPVVTMFVNLSINPRRATDTIIELISEIQQPISNISKTENCIDASIVSLVTAQCQRQIPNVKSVIDLVPGDHNDVKVNDDSINTVNLTGMSIDTQNKISYNIIKINTLQDQLDRAILEKNFTLAQTIQMEIVTHTQNRRLAEIHHIENKRNAENLNDTLETLVKKESKEDCDSVCDDVKKEQEVADKVDVKSDDLYKCLIILKNLLRNVLYNSLPGSVCNALISLVLPTFQQREPRLRLEALLTVGLCSLFDKNKALDHIALILKISDIDHDEYIRYKAVSVIFDLLTIYSFRLIVDGLFTIDNFPVHLDKDMKMLSLSKYNIATKRLVLPTDNKSFFEETMAEEENARILDKPLFRLIISQAHVFFTSLFSQESTVQFDGNCKINSDESMGPKELLLFYMIRPLATKAVNSKEYILVIDGICRILVRGVIYSSALLAKLLIIMFCPSNARYRSVQILSAFFARYGLGNSKWQKTNDWTSIIDPFSRELCHAWIIALKEVLELSCQDSQYNGVYINLNHFLFDVVHVKSLSYCDKNHRLKILIEENGPSNAATADTVLNIDTDDTESLNHVDSTKLLKSKVYYKTRNPPHEYFCILLLDEMLTTDSNSLHTIFVKTLLILEYNLTNKRHYLIVADKISACIEHVKGRIALRELKKLRNIVDTIIPLLTDQVESVLNTNDTQVDIAGNETLVAETSLGTNETIIPFQSKTMKLGVPGDTILCDSLSISTAEVKKDYINNVIPEEDENDVE